MKFNIFKSSIIGYKNLVKGSESQDYIDYKEDDIAAEFVFDNPLVSQIISFKCRRFLPVGVERVFL